MVAVNRTVLSMPVRNYVFVLTDAIARKGRRRKGGGEADSNMLGANDRDVLNINVKLTISGFRIPKLGVSYTFQSINCSNG